MEGRKEIHHLDILQATLVIRDAVLKSGIDMQVFLAAMMSMIDFAKEQGVLPHCEKVVFNPNPMKGTEGL